jgi:hypothetical protein
MFISSCTNSHVLDISIDFIPNAQTCREPQPSLVFYWGKSQAKEVLELGLLLMKMTRQTCKFLTVSNWTKKVPQLL